MKKKLLLLLLNLIIISSLATPVVSGESAIRDLYAEIYHDTVNPLSLVAEVGEQIILTLEAKENYTHIVTLRDTTVNFTISPYGAYEFRIIMREEEDLIFDITNCTAFLTLDITQYVPEKWYEDDMSLTMIIAFIGLFLILSVVGLITIITRKGKDTITLKDPKISEEKQADGSIKKTEKKVFFDAGFGTTDEKLERIIKELKESVDKPATEDDLRKTIHKTMKDFKTDVEAGESAALTVYKELQFCIYTIRNLHALTNFISGQLEAEKLNNKALENRIQKMDRQMIKLGAVDMVSSDVSFEKSGFAGWFKKYQWWIIFSVVFLAFLIGMIILGIRGQNVPVTNITT